MKSYTLISDPYLLKVTLIELKTKHENKRKGKDPWKKE